MDDIAIHTKPQEGETEQQHQERHRQYVHRDLDILEANDLDLKPEKCEFEQKEIDYLGVIVGRNQLRMDPKKIKGVAEWKTPTNLLRHGRDVHPTWVKSSIKTLSNTRVWGSEYKGKVQRGL